MRAAALHNPACPQETCSSPVTSRLRIDCENGCKSKGEANWRGSGAQKIGGKTQVAEATGAYVAAGSERANMEDIEKNLGDAKANLAKVLVAAELLDLAHRRIVARKVYQLAHLIWNVPHMGGGIKLETMLKNLHDLTQIFLLRNDGDPSQSGVERVA